MAGPPMRLRWLRFLGWSVLGVVALFGALIATAWWWTGRDDSLAAVLSRAQRYLPEGQTLQARDVTGSLRGGGRIAYLRWQNAGLAITAEQLDVGWDIAILLRSKLHLSHLKMAQLQIENTAPASTTPFTPPQSVVLPIEVDIPFEIATLRWAGPPVAQAEDLAGRYRYDGTQHALSIASLQLAEGHHRGEATLLARAPLTLQATASGDILARLPESLQQQSTARGVKPAPLPPLPLAAQVAVQGNLAGPDATLSVQAQLAPANASPANASRGSAMQASATAKIQPWAPQPLLEADARFAHINLASLLPGMPQTLLSGDLQFKPEGNGWQAAAQATNAASGPWDKQRVPVDAVQAKVRLQQGSWLVDALQARIGPGAISATGHWQGDAAAWQLRAELRDIDPARAHSQFASAVLSGHANAEGKAGAIAFDVDLQPAAQQAKGSPLQGLRLREVQAKGRWVAPLLTLSALKLRTDDALLQGQLALQINAKSGNGDLRLTLPGGQATLRGQLAASSGAGDFALDFADADKAGAWLAQWPSMPAFLAGNTLQGQATLKGRWQGGWDALQPGAARSGAAPALQATLDAPRLSLRTAGQRAEEALTMRALRAELGGNLNALTLSLGGEFAQGPRKLQLQTQASGGRIGNSFSDWQARIAALTLQLQDSARPGNWRVQLREPFAMNVKMGSGTTRLETSSGELLLTGPVPGTARILWEPVLLQQTGTSTSLRSAGRIQDLPMAWADALLAGSGTQLANTPFMGNMVFDGAWDLLAADTLRLQASLERKSGDLSVLNEDLAGGRIDAGVRQARATLSTEGDRVRASLRWDSERAGQAQADFDTRVSRGEGGWRWADDAAVAGMLKASLPRVGAWSMLAPPGWRMRGTLEAHASLSGTRQAPQWSGNVNADDLALRSVVEGIELRDGRLRASLRGQRLELTEFTLRGAPVAGGAPTSGGMLTAMGFAEWIPGSGLRSDVQAQAQALRASLRADRRLVVSGQVRAQTEGPKLTVRGSLKADQAMFILPDESAPSLGTDVVVKTRAKPGAEGTAATSTASAAVASAAPPDASDKRTVDALVNFDMGDDFRIQGRGLATRLKGELTLVSLGRAGTWPRVTGELRTERGSYRAYGQALDIETGILRFSGAYDNPALDVLAIRPNMTQRVGVQITGSALSPRIRLYADPELPDAEKLAWLVLGRSAASGGAEAAVLQQAALALLGGNGRGLSGGLAQALGLDELSFRGATSASSEGGTASSATVTLGKRLSRNFYVAYERSLAGTLGSFYIFYDLSRRLTLRAQAGEKSALDLIFTVPYD
jgi:translocation and assembly module TamB